MRMSEQFNGATDRLLICGGRYRQLSSNTELRIHKGILIRSNARTSSEARDQCDTLPDKNIIMFLAMFTDGMIQMLVECFLR